MDIYQLKTFVTIAKEGSITRASEILFISQPAVSAHIKAIEDEVGFVLFERTPRGMNLTDDGCRLLIKAEQTLAAHQNLINEAKQIKGKIPNKIRIGSNRTPSAHLLGKLLSNIAKEMPDLEVNIEYGSSAEILEAICKNTLDAGFYAHTGKGCEDLYTFKVDEFGVYLAAPPDWKGNIQYMNPEQLADLPWLCPVYNSCCGNVAEYFFEKRNFRPAKPINVDQEKVTKTLITGGVGLGFLHADTAIEAAAKGEVILLGEVQQYVPVYFALLTQRMHEPLINSLVQMIKHLDNAAPSHH